jgi:hypothetical protein
VILLAELARIHYQLHVCPAMMENFCIKINAMEVALMDIIKITKITYVLLVLQTAVLVNLTLIILV